MLNIGLLCPAPRGLVLVYVNPPPIEEIDEDSVFTKTEDAACLAYLVGGRASLVAMALTPTGACMPASETEGFLGAVWEDDKAELDRLEAAAKDVYFKTIGKDLTDFLDREKP